MRRVTINDVAREAGVSVSTISKVVNGRDGIAPATQEHVRRVVEEMGYVGNIGAQALRARRTGVIGVLVSQFEPYSAEILKGVGEAAKGKDSEIMAWAGASNDPQGATGWEQKLIGRLAGTLIDGAIIVTPSAPARSGKFPVVAVDPQHIGSELPGICADDEGGIQSAVRHLVQLGHTRIGYLGGREDLASAAARESGFLSAMADAGLSVAPEDMQRGDYTAAGAVEPTARLLDGEKRPSAIVAANDVAALQIVAGAHLRGLSVPSDLSVVGFDDIPDAARHGLTTVAQPLNTIGSMALTMLLDLLAGRTIGTIQHKLPTQLVVRATTAPPMT